MEERGIFDMNKLISVAIDGPAGAGKSTVATGVAESLGFVYVDTGALYRTIALFLLENQIDDKLSEIKVSLEKIKIDFYVESGKQVIKLFGEDIAEKIRTPEVSMMASKIAAIKEVRDFLMDFQRSVAKNYNVVMEGRDVGTVVLPNASVKIFLTASCEERAKRRFNELQLKGSSISYQEVLKQVKDRDHNDESREIAPLKKADDAICVDSSKLTQSDVINLIVKIIRKEVLRENKEE